MKKTISLIFILLFTLTGVRSQICFPDHGTWNQKYHSIAWGHGGEILWDITNYNTFRIVGDTVINDLPYYRLVKNQTINYLVSENQNRVYIGPNPDSMELCFDYNLNPGDTFHFNAPNFSAWPYVLDLEVLSADSILINGTLRKHLVFDDIPNYGKGPEWIQGIGDINFGGIEMDYSYTSWVGNTMTLECFTQSGQNIYGVCTLDMPDLCQTSLIAPNPSHGLIRINTSEFTGQIIVNVFTPEGCKVFSTVSGDAPQTILDLSILEKGVYILNIKDLKGHTVSRKIIIQ